MAFLNFHFTMGKQKAVNEKTNDDRSDSKEDNFSFAHEKKFDANLGGGIMQKG